MTILGNFSKNGNFYFIIEIVTLTNIYIVNASKKRVIAAAYLERLDESPQHNPDGILSSDEFHNSCHSEQAQCCRIDTGNL